MLYAIAVLIALIADQGLKYYTITHVAFETGEIPLIPGVIHLAHIHNYGAAYGIFKDWDARWFLVALAVIFCGVLIYLLASRRIHSAWGRWSAALLMAGALGNAIDRAHVGYVVDMLELEFKIFGRMFPVFNVADIFVVVFGILFCVYIVFHRPEEDDEPSFSLKRRNRSFSSENSVEIDNEDRRGGDIEQIRHMMPSGRKEHSATTSRTRETRERPYIAQQTAPKRKEATSSRHSAPKSEDFDLDDILAEFKDK